MDFKVAVKMRAQNGFLVQLLNDMGITQKECAKRIGINPGSLNSYVNMRAFPGQGHLEKLCALAGMSAEELFPEYLSDPEFLKLNKTCTLFKDLDVKYLPHSHLDQIAGPEPIVDSFDAKDFTSRLIGTLDLQEQQIITESFFEDKSLAEIAERHNLTCKHVRHVRDNALKRLKTNSEKVRSKALLEKLVDPKAVSELKEKKKQGKIPVDISRVLSEIELRAAGQQSQEVSRISRVLSEIELRAEAKKLAETQQLQQQKAVDAALDKLRSEAKVRDRKTRRRVNLYLAKQKPGPLKKWGTIMEKNLTAPKKVPGPTNWKPFYRGYVLKKERPKT